MLKKAEKIGYGFGTLVLRCEEETENEKEGLDSSAYIPDEYLAEFEKEKTGRKDFIIHGLEGIGKSILSIIQNKENKRAEFFSRLLEYTGREKINTEINKAKDEDDNYSARIKADSFELTSAQPGLGILLSLLSKGDIFFDSNLFKEMDNMEKAFVDSLKMHDIKNTDYKPDDKYIYISKHDYKKVKEKKIEFMESRGIAVVNGRPFQTETSVKPLFLFSDFEGSTYIIFPEYSDFLNKKIFDEQIKKFNKIKDASKEHEEDLAKLEMNEDIDAMKFFQLQTKALLEGMTEVSEQAKLKSYDELSFIEYIAEKKNCRLSEIYLDVEVKHIKDAMGVIIKNTDPESKIDAKNLKFYFTKIADGCLKLKIEGKEELYLKPLKKYGAGLGMIAEKTSLNTIISSNEKEKTERFGIPMYE